MGQAMGTGRGTLNFTAPLNSNTSVISHWHGKTGLSQAARAVPATAAWRLRWQLHGRNMAIGRPSAMGSDELNCGVLELHSSRSEHQRRLSLVGG